MKQRGTIRPELDRAVSIHCQGAKITSDLWGYLGMDDLADLPTENLNIRYLAWKDTKGNPDPVKWVSVLRKKAGLPDREARAILAGSPLSNKDRDAIVEGFGIDRDELGTARLFGLSSDEILKENIRYLIRSLPKGGKKALAGALQVKKESVSRWASGKNPPSAQNIQQIAQYLSLDSNINLREVPLFLSFRPVGHYAQREWVQKQVASLPAEELSKLFPALERLLDHHEKC